MKKGFTLIELLAVIVILAVIALIAIPIVMNIIEDAKKNSAINSAKLYVDGLSKYLCARDIPQVQPDFDITPLEDSILELESTKWSNQFLYNVKGSRKELHKGVIQKNEAKSLAKRMARVVSGLKKSS